MDMENSLDKSKLDESTALTISEPNSMPCGSENVTGILPTANMCLQGVNGMKSIARVLFDTGAQKSYVIKSLVDKLKIEPFKYKSLKIEG